MPSYSKRRNLFEKNERVWRITDVALVAVDHLGHENAAAWQDVVALRLAFAPTRFKMWRHVVVLRFRNGERWEIDNAHFAGVANFENRSASYSPFVRELVARVKARSPTAKARVGEALLNYWLLLLGVAAVFVLAAFLLLGLPLDGIPGVTWAKLAIILLLLPALGGWAWKARPRKVRLGDIPEDALPKTG